MYFGEIIICTTFLMHTVTGSALHGPCTSNEECGTLDTFCNNDICVCRENFAVKDDTCVHVATPNIHCKTRHDCKEILGARSLCTKNSLCACTPFHHLHNNTCVKNRDLNDSCQQDHQCYCGADCEDKIACIDKTCNCKPGHKPYLIRRCRLDPTFTSIQSTTSIPSTTTSNTTHPLHNSAADQSYIFSTVIITTIIVKIL